MNFLEFARQWIEIHVGYSELYGDKIAERVWRLCETFDKQSNSGASAVVVFSFFTRLMKDYLRQKVVEPDQNYFQGG